MSAKYPRSMHVPFSPGTTSDDRLMSEAEFETFVGEILVITEKLDGSNVCLTSDELFARTHSGPPAHVSFDPLKKLHSILRHQIDKNLSVFGEWCYAVHSIEYSMLQHHLNIFGVRDDSTGEWWNWDSVLMMSEHLNIPTVPVILVGAFGSKEELKNTIETFANLSSVYGPTREGLVVRKFYDVSVDEGKLVGLAKWVRKNHVQTDEHWTRKKVQKQPSIHCLEK